MELRGEVVDLMRLKDVRRLSRRLIDPDSGLPKLDVMVLNAGIGGWTGLNWPKCIWNVYTDFLTAVTWPTYKIGPVGVLTDKQTSQPDEPPLGAVFCANVFGHYMLAHYVMPLLKRSGQLNRPGRIIWVSSLDATTNGFDAKDMQGLKTNGFYETSKTLTDLLALTSTLSSTAHWRASFMSEPTLDISPSSLPQEQHHILPNQYLSHPGVCGTGIAPLPLILFPFMTMSTYVARWIGSPWHCVTTYLGACAPVWLALSPQSVLDDAEHVYKEHGGADRGRAKWGSSTNRMGQEKAISTEVEGWGFGGVIGRPVLQADAALPRKRGATDLTAEDRTRFEELGQRCWQEMEELRMQWDELLDRDEALTSGKD